MKRGYVTGVAVALGLAAFIVWLAENTYWEEIEVRSSPSGAALTNPFYAAQRLADLLGAKTRLRREIVSLPSRRAVLVLGDWNWSLIPERRTRLEQWVAEGGRLVVAADLIADQAFDTWTGVKRLPVDLDRRKNDCAPGKPCPGPGVAQREDPHNPAHGHFAVCKLWDSSRLTTTRKVSWQLRDQRGHLQAVRVPIGSGSVTMINGLPFGNADLLCGDDASLFAAATQLGTGADLQFLTEDRGSSLLPLLWSHGAPVIILGGLLIVLGLWRSAVRFGPLVATPDPARRSLAEQIRGTGRFALRVGGGAALHRAAARAFNETAARHVRGYEHLAGDARIASLAPLTGLSPGELSAALAEDVSRAPLELRRAITVLETARRNLEPA